MKLKPILLEATLTKKERDQLPDDAFGIPELRKYPIHDKTHVLQAIRFFGKAPEDKKKELAKRIKKKADEFGIEISSKSEIAKYL